MVRRSTAGLVFAMWIATGCKSVPSSGDVLAPRAVSSAAPATTPTTDAPVEPTGDGGDPFADDRPDDEPEVAAALTNDDLMMGLPTLDGSVPSTSTATALSGTPYTPPAAVAVPTTIATVPAPSAPAWPSPVPMSAFGVRLVSTVADAQPPRAILGMPDGTEKVVRPGDLIPEVGVVVLAIGRDQVQIATIIADGDHARVEPSVLGSLFPATPQGTVYP